MKKYFENEIGEKRKRISLLEKDISRIQSDIEKITGSKAYRYWTALEKNKFSPFVFLDLNSLRHKAISFIRNINNEMRAKKYITRLDDVKVSKNYKISVVIPTYYAEDFMPALLRAIAAQKYIEDLDLIIIDSESKDKTQELAKEHGANVLTIKQKDFTHSSARNIAAKEAKHDLILFTVQDELPADNDTFAKMAELISQDEKIAAVSTKQIARPDADLFAHWQVDNHNESLDLTYDSVSKVNNLDAFTKEPFILQRRVSLLDDVCALYKKDIFEELSGFTEIPFGEDLDYAFKIFKNGYKVGLLCSSGVIHSHNRQASYFLKRTFVSSILDLDLLSAVSNKLVVDPTLDLIAGLTISKYLSNNRNLNEFSTDDLDSSMDEIAAEDLEDLKENDFQLELSKLLYSILQEIKLPKNDISNEDILNYYQLLLDILNSYLNQHLHIIATDKDKLIFLEKMLAAKIGDALARHCLGKQTTLVKKNKQFLLKALSGNV